MNAVREVLKRGEGNDENFRFQNVVDREGSLGDGIENLNVVCSDAQIEGLLGAIVDDNTVRPSEATHILIKRIRSIIRKFQIIDDQEFPMRKLRAQSGLESHSSHLTGIEGRIKMTKREGRKRVGGVYNGV